MRILLILFALAFALLPYDAQLWLIGLLRSTPPELLIVLLVFGWPAWWYALGWNALAAQQRDQAVEKAEQAYKQARR